MVFGGRLLRLVYLFEMKVLKGIFCGLMVMSLNLFVSIMGIFLSECMVMLVLLLSRVVFSFLMNKFLLFILDSGWLRIWLFFVVMLCSLMLYFGYN